MRKNFLVYSERDWAKQSALFIHNLIQEKVSANQFCNVVLTGGRSAEKLYLEWANLSEFKELTNVNFYLSDERCVSSDDPDSNYGMILRTLFSKGIPNSCKIFQMFLEDLGVEKSIKRYEKLLPSKIDCMLLGLGDDGHIASIFPNDETIHQSLKKVTAVVGPFYPFNRLTLTPIAIKMANSFCILVTQKSKIAVMKKIKDKNETPITLPIKLTLNANWILNFELGDIVE